MVEFLYWKEIFQCFDIGKGKEYRESIVLGILSYLKGHILKILSSYTTFPGLG